MTDLAFSLDQVRYIPDHTLILDDVSLDVSSGHWVGVLGPNGAGKSTLVDLIARFDDPSSGEIWINSLSLKDKH